MISQCYLLKASCKQYYTKHNNVTSKNHIALTDLNIQMRLAVPIIKYLLVVIVLSIPFRCVVIPKVITKWGKNNISLIQLCFLMVLFKQQTSPAKKEQLFRINRGLRDGATSLCETLTTNHTLKYCTNIVHGISAVR
jgi:hypothetical protein